VDKVIRWLAEHLFKTRPSGAVTVDVANISTLATELIRQGKVRGQLRPM